MTPHTIKMESAISEFICAFSEKAQSQGYYIGSPQIELFGEIPSNSDLAELYKIIGSAIPPHDYGTEILSLVSAIEVSKKYNVVAGKLLFSQRDVYAESFLFDLSGNEIHSDRSSKTWRLRDFLTDILSDL